MNKHRRIGQYDIIAAPKQLVLLPEYADDVIQFVRGLASKTENGGKLCIDFSGTDLISALGAVYLYSEIDKILLRDSGRVTIRIKIGNKSNQQVRDILRATGLFELCGYLDTLPRSGLLPIIRGENDEKLRDITQYLMGSALIYNQLSADNRDNTERLVNKALLEAMLNVTQHAYLEDAPNRFWWATATIVGHELHVALCDRGIGIPSTLQSKGWFQSISQALPIQNKEANMIKTAMGYHRSPHRKDASRGLGSRDIQDLILQASTGHLTIVSGKGHYRLQGESKNEEAKELEHDINGTFIQWRIPLESPAGGKQ